MVIAMERISFILDPRDLLLSFDIYFSFVRAEVACANLERMREPLSMYTCTLSITQAHYLVVATVFGFNAYICSNKFFYRVFLFSIHTFDLSMITLHCLTIFTLFMLNVNMLSYQYTSRVPNHLKMFVLNVNIFTH